ncbi:MAG: hypothetical protein AB7N71_01805 [Phycisphaerae bacterium]
MRGATLAAKKVKKAFAELKKAHGKQQEPGIGDPIQQLLLGVFSRNAPENKAREAVEKLQGMVVDFNELRVTPVTELAQAVGGSSEMRRKCEDISRALNAIFAIEFAVSLDRVAKLPKRESREFLTGLDGLDAYSRARIRLYGFGHHAIPLDEAMWAVCREHELVDPECTLEESQNFLERQIPDGQAFEFVALLRKQAWADKGNAVKKGQVTTISSEAPDRSSTNMLQQVASGVQLPSMAPPADKKKSESIVVDDKKKAAKSRAKDKSDDEAAQKTAKSGAKATARPARVKDATNKKSRAAAKKTPAKRASRSSK